MLFLSCGLLKLDLLILTLGDFLDDLVSFSFDLFLVIQRGLSFVTALLNFILGMFLGFCKLFADAFFDRIRQHHDVVFFVKLTLAKVDALQLPIHVDVEAVESVVVFREGDLVAVQLLLRQAVHLLLVRLIRLIDSNMRQLVRTHAPQRLLEDLAPLVYPLVHVESFMEFHLLRVDHHLVIFVKKWPFPHDLATFVLVHLKGGRTGQLVGICVSVVESDQEVLVFSCATFTLLLLFWVVFSVVGMEAYELEVGVGVQAEELRLEHTFLNRVVQAVDLPWSAAECDVLELRSHLFVAVAQESPKDLQLLMKDQELFILVSIFADSLHEDVVRLIDDITRHLAIAILAVLCVLDLPAADLVVLVVVQEEVFALRQICHLCAVCLEVCTLEASLLSELHKSNL